MRVRGLQVCNPSLLSANAGTTGSSKNQSKRWVHSEQNRGYIQVHSGTFGYIRVHSDDGTTFPVLPNSHQNQGILRSTLFTQGTFTATTHPLYKIKKGELEFRGRAQRRCLLEIYWTTGSWAEKQQKLQVFLAKTKELLEFYHAFCWGCREVHKTHNFGVPRGAPPTIPPKTRLCPFFVLNE